MPDQPRDPDTHERVRRLLAEARHDQPMPDDVAARLDQALADLAAEPAARDNVVRLSERRRRAATLLVAAAAVVAVGVGIGQLAGNTGSGSAASGGGADSAGLAPEQAGSAPAASPTSSDGLDSLTGTRSHKAGIRIRPHHFSVDVRANLPTMQAFDSAVSNGSHGGGCRMTAWGSGRYVGVTYAGTPGFLVFRKPGGDTQVVDLYLCGSPSVLRSVTLPRP